MHSPISSASILPWLAPGHTSSRRSGLAGRSCNMCMWRHISHSEPCRICDKLDWCSISADGAWALCRRIDTGAGLHKVDKAGADYWLYRLDGHSRGRHLRSELPSQSYPERADPATLDRVYRALLAALPLSPTQRQALRQRGLSDREIIRRGYRSLPTHNRATRARQLVEDFGADVCAKIPGLYLAERGSQQWWSLAGRPGLLIPVRDCNGRIVALKVRADVLGRAPSTRTSARLSTAVLVLAPQYTCH